LRGEGEEKRRTIKREGREDGEKRTARGIEQRARPEREKKETEKGKRGSGGMLVRNETGTVPKKMGGVLHVIQERFR